MNLKICLYFYLICYSNGYLTSPPIVWQSDNLPAIRAITKGIFIFLYENPCDYFESHFMNGSIGEYEFEFLKKNPIKDVIKSLKHHFWNHLKFNKHFMNPSLKVYHLFLNKISNNSI